MILRRPNASASTNCTSTSRISPVDEVHYSDITNKRRSVIGVRLRELFVTRWIGRRQPSHHSPHPSTSICKYPIASVGILMIVILMLILLLLQLHAYTFEYQGVLDHFVSSAILKAHYGRFCPDFSFDDGIEYNNYATERIPKDGTSTYKTINHWDCNSQTGSTKTATNNHSPYFPQIIMMGARDKDANTFEQWKQILHNSSNQSLDQRNNPRLQRINTLKISNQYALGRGADQRQHRDIEHNPTTPVQNITTQQSRLEIQHKFSCRKMKWEQRLFAVYQSLFHQLLTDHPDEAGFVIVEDDAILVNPRAFATEVCSATQHELEFYSLYRSPLQWQGRREASCIYEHGTVAFYIRRGLMETVVNEQRRGWFCRFPIDMYISKLGPWYATRREIVGHSGAGRIGSVG